MSLENKDSRENNSNNSAPRKRYSIDHPVEEDLQQQMPTASANMPTASANAKIETPLPRPIPKPLLVLLLLACATCAVLARNPLLTFIASYTPSPDREATRLAIVNSPRLSKEQKKQYEKEYQDAFTTPQTQSSALMNLASSLASTDYVAAVYVDDYLSQHQGSEAIFYFGIGNQVPSLSGEELLQESQKATQPRIKNALMEYAIYAFAKSDGTRALELCQQMSTKAQDPKHHAMVEARLVQSLVENPKNIEKALALAQGITEEKPRSSALYHVFGVLIKTDIKQAETLLPEIKDFDNFDDYHTQSVTIFVKALILIQPKKALGEARRLVQSENLLSVLEKMGVNIGIYGPYDLNRVLSFSKMLSNTAEQDSFLKGIVSGCSSAGGQAFTKQLEVSETPASPLEIPTMSLEKPTMSLEKPTMSLEKPTMSLEKPTMSLETRAMFALQVVPHIKNAVEQQPLYLGIISGFSPQVAKKMIPQVLAFKEEPLASQMQKLLVMRLVNFYLASEQQDPTTALPIAQQIKDSKERSEALYQVALSWRKLNPQKGMEIAQQIPQEDIRERILAKLTPI
jgi:hypothetical protein